MPFIATVPQPSDKLKDSQGQLLGNNQQLDTSFGIDHYTFSNLTTDNGKHNQVTTPKIVGAAHPTTAANEPKFYGMQDAVQLGVIQYSRGPSDAVPSPLTRLHSAGVIAIAATSNLDVFNFGLTTLIPRSMATLTVFKQPIANISSCLFVNVYWDGKTLVVNNTVSPGASFQAQVSGSILQIRNGIALGINVYWTLEFQRLQ